MVIKKVNNNLVDVFWNTGWDSWARMQSGSKGSWNLVGGTSMPRRVFSEFRNRVSSNKVKGQHGTKRNQA